MKTIGERNMAGSPGTEEDSIYDTGRLSLFDLIMERTRAQNKVKCCCCFYGIPLDFSVLYRCSTGFTVIPPKRRSKLIKKFLKFRPVGNHVMYFNKMQ